MGKMDEKAFKSYFCDYWDVKSDTINEKLELNDENIDGFTSIGLFEFLANVEKKFDVKVENINEILTYGDLMKSIK